MDGARLLVEAGADVNARQHGGYTPLHSAAQRGAIDLIDLLLAAGADTDGAADDGRRPDRLRAGAGAGGGGGAPAVARRGGVSATSAD